MAAAATTLYANGRGLTDIDSAANVLDPAAYPIAPHVLALAFIGTAVLAVSPLAGSAAHAVVGGMFESEDKALADRRVSLPLLIVMLLGGATGVALTCVHAELLRLLDWSAILNGSTVHLIMSRLVLPSTKHSAVGDPSAHWVLRSQCWLATSCAAAALHRARCANSRFPGDR
ncbi:divalent metal cation transporter [Paraburkholderia sp. SIMBA_054]|uniref:divalent metal cation transporter n=1 Tax=Paraburkholderia sp. SIMBA_054 TaxID=3085795 RepID=UPI00397E6EB7